MALTVRKALPDEYARIAEVVKTSFEHLAVQYQNPKGIAFFEQFSSGPAIQARDLAGSTTYVALIQNVIIGVLQANQQHIELLYVLSELQSRGVGRGLVKAADADCKLKTVNATVNSMMAFMRYGFMPCGADQVADSGLRFMPMQRS